jgi:hypothetical protein
MSRAKAALRFERLRREGFSPAADLSPEAATLRQALLAAISFDPQKGEYQQDLAAGLGCYRILPPERLTLRAAADDGVWRYLSLDVLPDIVHKRGGDSEELFWRDRWRIWLKRVWWYTHLGWQGSEDDTRKALAERTTDTIAQFVERAGSGYRVDLWRSLASRFPRDKVSQDQFRRLMKLNTALLVSVEPSLSEGGLDGYVDRLYAAVAETPRRRE